MFKFNRSSGQASRLLLVLAVVILVAVIIVYLVMRMAEKPPAPNSDPATTIPQPVYKQTLNKILFLYESAIDRGNVLRVSQIASGQYNSYYQKDFFVSNTGAKFIQVTIGAQNVGTENIGQGGWGLVNIVDSEGRNFVPLDGYSVSAWLPNPDMCGTLLKPAFDPTPCTRIYEVSKVSSGFKIQVKTGEKMALIDLIVK
ncbi:MAG: hypothetical protein NTW11_01275 [Candidatus Staskawiczbacteria bacterium]|nr:hypothetical protein [Candidatus Staskawiczbacteria bacterium]